MPDRELLGHRFLVDLLLPRLVSESAAAKGVHELLVHGLLHATGRVVLLSLRLVAEDIVRALNQSEPFSWAWTVFATGSRERGGEDAKKSAESHLVVQEGGEHHRVEAARAIRVVISFSARSREDLSRSSTNPSTDRGRARAREGGKRATLDLRRSSRIRGRRFSRPLARFTHRWASPPLSGCSLVMRLR